MNPCKHPISHALTSFNGVNEEKNASPAAKPVAKVHHLHTSHVKRREGDIKSALDYAIEQSRDFFFREQLPQGYWWA